MKRIKTLDNIITQEELKEVLEYCPDSGFWFWNKNRPNAKKGCRAGYLCRTQGYNLIGVYRLEYRCSRLAFLYMKGYFPEHDVDHINRVRNDDRWCNLREATRQCNLRNSSIRSDNTSGITGVSFNEHRGKWVAALEANKKTFRKRFLKKKDAVFYRWELEKKNNFPNCCTTSLSYNYLLENGIIK